MFIKDFMFNSATKVYVVFVDETSLWWLRFLKKGFRHCYILLSIDNNMTWLEINPMSNQVFINFYQFLEAFDYASFIEHSKEGSVCAVNVGFTGVGAFPLFAFTCVELVKRVLGIRSFFTITPYQLYKKIKGCRKKVLI